MTGKSLSASPMSERVICVDENDMQVGDAEKIHAHATGTLHRAFSVFLFDRQGRLLMQRRAAGKYHAGGLWANSCCGHPRPGEETSQAAVRRLAEELGITVHLEAAFSFRYRVQMDNGLIENELVHMMVGAFSGDCNPDGSEVSDIAWHELEAVAARAEDLPHQLAPWFRIYLRGCLPMLISSRDRLLHADTPS